MAKRVLIIPTYNESKNIGPLLDQILALKIEGLTIVVVDDTSPDGTSEIVRAYAEKHVNVVLLQRVGLRGRGTAGIAGFDFAVKLGADEIVEMDSDFSHPPEELPKLFELLKTADVSIASRLVDGAVDVRPFKRRFITMLANIYARFWLEAPSHKSKIVDWTTGYRGYRRTVFDRVPPASMISQGPSVVQELLLRAMNAGCTAVEIPFRMIDRVAGRSTFNRKVALQSILSIPAYRVLFSPKAEPVVLPKSEAEKKSERYYVLKKD